MTERATGRRVRERLSTNENEFGVAPGVLEAIAAAAATANRYPDCDHFTLRQRLGEAVGVDPAAVRIGSGIDGLLGQVCRTFLGDGRFAVASDSTYPTFGYFAGTSLRLARCAGARLDPAAMIRSAAGDAGDRSAAGDAGDQAAVVYVAEPDNPTGAELGRDTILALADALPERTLLVLDGAYAEYQDPGRAVLPADVLDRRMLWLRTFSKAYALAGMRVGYAIGRPDLLAELDAGAEHYVVGRIAEAAAVAALGQQAFLRAVLRQTAEGVSHYTAALTALGFPVLPSATNFVTFRCGDPPAATRLAGSLAERGIFVRQVAAPGLTDCIRLTVGPPGQRAAVLAAIADLVPPAAPARGTVQADQPDQPVQARSPSQPVQSVQSDHTPQHVRPTASTSATALER
jgi:histidinol-phosphate aminotransferase